MIIDQLPLLSGDVQSTDEIPIERGTTTYKTTADKITVQTDPTPTQGSTKPVQSGGVYDALQTVQAAADAAQSTADGVGASLATYVRPNLLENWYFVGGGSQQGYGYFPLNSKGQTVYSGVGETIDKWFNVYGNGTVELLSSGVRLSEYQWFAQYLDPVYNLVGKTLTGSVLLADGSLHTGSIVYTGESYQTIVQITSGSQPTYLQMNAEARGRCIRIVTYGSGTPITVVAVKLEIGSTQTLAHQESGVWVLNEVPSYGEEYAETVVSRKQLDWKLLWTNPNPSAEFAAQMVSLDLSKYQEVLIKLPVWADNTDQQCMCEYGLVGSRIWPTYWQNDTPAGNAVLTTRRMEVSASGVNVAACYSKSGTSAASVTNNLLVPRYIYAR